MRFEPRAPDAEINVSKTHPLVEASTLLLGLIGLLALVTVLIVFAIEILIRFIPEEKEVKWFSGWTPVERLQSDHPQAEAVADLLARMVAQWPDTEYQFRLEISDDPAPNAMALPGGLIIVTSGLLDQIDTENALAFVLSHELGHFHNRDHIRQLGRFAAIGLFYSAVSASNGNTALGYNVTDLTLRGFSRAQERDADKFGLELVEREYGHIGEALQFFERLSDEREPGIRWDNYLGTHPDPQDRIAELTHLAEQNGWRLSGEVFDWPPTARIE
ncbi:MAG: M48 family metallopeptidase [Pseudomonadota bacterium]